MVKANKHFLLIALFLVCTFVLRLFNVTEIPAGLYWDEAAITYNAFGIAEWNRDEWGNKFPISFKSFGDYKAPLLIYVLSIPYKIFGLHIDWLRYIAVLVGTGNVLLTFLLFKKIVPKTTFLTQILFLGLAATTPWYFHFSRFGNEASLALFCLLTGVLFFVYAHKKPLLYVASAILFVSSMYAYHSAKLYIPLLVLILLVQFHHQIKFHLKLFALALITGGLLLAPLAHDSFIGSGFERGKSLIFYESGVIAPLPTIASKLFSNLVGFFTLSYWVNGTDAIGFRHGLTGFGVMLRTGLILALIGFYLTLTHKDFKKYQWLVIAGLVGILPSTLSQEAPHAIRSMLAAPWFLLLSGIAIIYLFSRKNKVRSGIIVQAVICIGVIAESSLYVYTYFTKYPFISAPHFQFGYKQAFDFIEKHKYEADTFIITDKLGQPYIYSLLYRGITPEEYKFGALANYEFHEIKWPDNRKRRMYVATPQEIPPTDPAVVEVIPYPNSSEPALVIALN